MVKSAGSPGKGTGVSRTRKSHCDDRFGKVLLRPPRDLRTGGAPGFGAFEGQRDRRAAAYTDQVSGGDTEPVEGRRIRHEPAGRGGGISACAPSDRLKIGEIIRFIDGPIAPVDCVSVSRPKECEYPGHCPFFGFWGRVRQAISDVVDQTTFADLIKENASLGLVYIPDWTI